MYFINTFNRLFNEKEFDWNGRFPMQRSLLYLCIGVILCQWLEWGQKVEFHKIETIIFSRSKLFFTRWKVFLKVFKDFWIRLKMFENGKLITISTNSFLLIYRYYVLLNIGHRYNFNFLYTVLIFCHFLPWSQD